MEPVGQYADFADLLKKRMATLDLGEVENENETNPIVRWADAYRKLPSSSSAGGRYRAATTPYVRGIYEALHDQTGKYQIVAVMKAGQIGLTEVGVNFVGYTIDKRPVPILMIFDTGHKASSMRKGRLLPMFRQEPLRAIIKDTLSKGTRESETKIQYPGGDFTMGGSNSTSSFSSITAGVVILDEFARFPANVKGEGDPRTLARARGFTFGNRFKLYIPSTPVDRSDDPGSFVQVCESGDMRQFFMPCPHCDHFDFFCIERFKYVRLEEGRFHAYMHCRNCNVKIEEHYKTAMLKRGIWKPTKDPDYHGVTSFVVPGFLSPLGWLSWETIASEHFLALSHKASLRGWHNLYAGVPYDELIEIPEAEAVQKRYVMPYKRGTCPKEVKFLTMAVDVQRGWCKWEVKGWANNFVSFSIDTGIIDHNIDTASGEEAIESLIYRKWAHAEGGYLPIYLAAIDSGDQSQIVYDFVSRFPQPLIAKNRMVVLNEYPCVIATKGASQHEPMQIITRVSPIRKRKEEPKFHTRMDINLWVMGAPIIKMQLYSVLAVMNERSDKGKIPSGTAFFPQTYPLSHFEELTAEQVKVSRNKQTGRPVKVFYCPEGKRNEALDLHVMNRFAAEVAGAARFSGEEFDDLFVRLLEQINLTREEEESERVPLSVLRKQKSSRRPSSRGQIF